MLSRKAKATFYLFASPVMRLNAYVYKYARHSTHAKPLKVHLGPGQEKYLAGWCNVDANMFTARCDVWADLRHPLPFRDGSVAAMYSHHVIEHLPNLRRHFEEVFRSLKAGGVYRVGGPNGDAAIAKFVERDLAWFDSWPDNRHSIGGRFENFVFCRGEHLTILTFSFVEELMREVGFADIRQCVPSKSTFTAHFFSECLALESESDLNAPHTLIVEAMKPAG